jgi:hypothetical protein
VNSKPIVIETTKFLQLPQVCVCCGKATKQSIVVKPTDPSKFKQEFALNVLGLAFPPAHFVLAAELFSTPNAKIPLCRKCKFNHFLPDKKVFAFLALLVLFFVAAFYLGFRAQYGYMLLCLLLAIACLVWVARKNISHDVSTLPVRIFQSNGKYRYAIFGGPLYELFNKSRLPGH